MLARQQQIRSDLRQRHENKRALHQTRVRQRKRRRGCLFISINEDVNINNARAPAPGSHSAHLFLDGKDSFQQSLRSERRYDTCGSIQKSG